MSESIKHQKQYKALQWISGEQHPLSNKAQYCMKPGDTMELLGCEEREFNGRVVGRVYHFRILEGFPGWVGKEQTAYLMPSSDFNRYFAEV